MVEILVIRSSRDNILFSNANMTTEEEPKKKTMTIDDIVETFEAENDDEDEDMEIEEEDGPDFPELLYSLLTTDEDESIANVLKGIRDGL